MKSRPEILEMVQAKIRLLHFAYSTEQAYCHWAGRYYDFCLTLPRHWPPERKAESFLTNLALKQNVAARTQNQALAALLLLYKDVMAKPLGNIDALRAKKPIHERTSPSRDQVLGHALTPMRWPIRQIQRLVVKPLHLKKSVGRVARFTPFFQRD